MAAISSNQLAKSLIFRRLSSHSLDDLSRQALSKTLIEGEFLATQGQIWPYLLLLQNGELKIHKVSPRGRSLGALRLEAGDLFCSPTLIDGGPLPATLEGGKDCEVFLWHKDQLLPYLQRNYDALWELSALLVERMRNASDMVEDLAFQPVASRVARMLLKQYQHSGDDHVERDLTLDDMASMVGTTPVMVCKILYQFADQGYLKVSRTEIEFINKDQLEKIVDNY